MMRPPSVSVLLLLQLLALQAPLRSFSFSPIPTRTGASKLRSPSFLFTATTTEQATTVVSATATAIDLPYIDYVSPDVTTSTPVLLLHGLLGSKRNFASLAKSLGSQLETPRRIMGVDLRNHGKA
jgi:hypothetical protein